MVFLFHITGTIQFVPTDGEWRQDWGNDQAIGYRPFNRREGHYSGSGRGLVVVLGSRFIGGTGFGSRVLDCLSGSG